MDNSRHIITADILTANIGGGEEVISRVSRRTLYSELTGLLGLQ